MVLRSIISVSYTHLDVYKRQLRTGVRQTVGYNPHFTTNPQEACVYLVLIGEGDSYDLSSLKDLPYWGGDGKC